jgi:hypothetical protein
MTNEEKRAFIVELIGNVQAEILAKVEAMPDEWDGHELRRFIADKFDQANMGLLATGRVRSQGSSKRMKSYRDAVLVLNL